jgi:hypothetical protein
LLLSKLPDYSIFVGDHIAASMMIYLQKNAINL